MTWQELFDVVAPRKTWGVWDSQEPVPSLSTDSRKLAQKPCIFAAIRGDQFDGHDFVETAAVSGAKMILIDRENTAIPSGAVVWLVDDVVSSLRKWAHAHRKKFTKPVIAVAGSQGKTTTKEILFHLLSQHGNVHKTQGSENGFLGIALTLLRLDLNSHDFAVVEVGIDDVDAMKSHAEIVNADIVVMTGIGPEHLENLVDIKTVWREERIILDQGLARGAKIFVNGGDDILKNTAYPQVIPFISESSLGIRFQDEKNDYWELPIVGAHHGSNLALAVAVVKSLGLKTSPKMLVSFSGEKGRSRFQKLSQGISLIDDAYNANPVSMEAALSILADPKLAGERVLVLGDMRELGEKSGEYHRQLLLGLEKIPYLRQVILVGPEMRSALDRIHAESKALSYRPLWVKNHESVMGVLDIHPADVVLVKASRGIALDHVVRAISERWQSG